MWLKSKKAGPISVEMALCSIVLIFFLIQIVNPVLDMMDGFKLTLVHSFTLIKMRNEGGFKASTDTYLENLCSIVGLNKDNLSVIATPYYVEQGNPLALELKYTVTRENIGLNSFNYIKSNGSKELVKKGQTISGYFDKTL